MKITYHIPDLVCPNCARYLEKLDAMLPGVSKVSANVPRHLLKVEFDEQRLSQETLERALTQLGYPPQKP